MASLAARRTPSVEVLWLAVLTLIGIFQVMRGARVSALVFGLALFLAVRRRSRTASHHRRARRTAPHPHIIAACALTCAGLLMATPRHGPAATAIVAVIGLAAAAITLRPAGAAPGPRRQGADASARPMHRCAAAWSALIVAAGLWEATAYLVGDRLHLVDPATMPAVTDVVDPLLRIGLVKNAFIAAWIAAGVALLRRVWIAPDGDRPRAGHPEPRCLGTRDPSAGSADIPGSAGGGAAR